MLAKLKLIPLVMAGFLSLLPLACQSKKESSDNLQAGGKNKKWDRTKANAESELIQAELRLAKTARPYLVLDFPSKEIRIKLKGAVVWNCPFDAIGADADALKSFAGRFRDNKNRLIRLLSDKHLFSASEKTPDSILAIVGEAVNVKPELLQREIPQRFQLLWDPGLFLEVRSDIVGKPTSKLKNTMLEVRRAIRRPFGESYLVVKMEPEQALTLYRASQPGLPTLIIPPH